MDPEICGGAAALIIGMHPDEVRIHYYYKYNEPDS